MIQEEKYLESKKNMTTVSLILTTYNSEKNIENILTSIEKQDYPLIEVLIKDGGSTDRTLHIIDVYAKISKHTVKWRTSRDNGIYDTMNQGYLMATGDVIVFFNGLFQEPTVVSKMIRMIEDHPECVGAYADLVYATDEKVIRYWKSGVQRSLYMGWMPGHPTLFLKREIYEKYGIYNSDFRIAADYEFMIRFLKDKSNRLAYLPEIIIRMDYDRTGTGSTKSCLLSMRERHRALKDNGVKGAFIIDILRTCRVLLQFILKSGSSK